MYYFLESGHPYMGVGRNLTYKKKKVFFNKQFINHIQIRSGDDDLFINEQQKNTILLTRKLHVF
jgi:hypothetical protein